MCSTLKLLQTQCCKTCVMVSTYSVSQSFMSAQLSFWTMWMPLMNPQLKALLGDGLAGNRVADLEGRIILPGPSLLSLLLGHQDASSFLSSSSCHSGVSRPRTEQRNQNKPLLLYVTGVRFFWNRKVTKTVCHQDTVPALERDAQISPIRKYLEQCHRQMKIQNGYCPRVQFGVSRDRYTQSGFIMTENKHFWGMI